MAREKGLAGAGRFGSGVGEFFTIYTLVDISQTGMLAQYKPDAPAFMDDINQLINI